ncbi:MAG: hypothetical protein K9K63_04745 [Desulfotignum sp.]|nr:hypothetical protein [Desulfotignum sp.]MCF8136599.1 hypothetical protein [Desulfotignum sp.]
MVILITRLVQMIKIPASMPVTSTKTEKGCPLGGSLFRKGKKDEKTNWRLVVNE